MQISVFSHFFVWRSMSWRLGQLLSCQSTMSPMFNNACLSHLSLGKSIDYANLCLLPLFCLTIDELKTWSTPLLPVHHVPHVYKRLSESSELGCCFPVRSGPHSVYPVSMISRWMVKLTMRLGAPLLRLSVNPSLSLRKPVLLACPMKKCVSRPASHLRK
jgi:hypothetical protein